MAAQIMSAPSRRQPVVQAARRIVRQNGDFAHVQYRSGIESRVHAHDADAGDGVAGQQRTLNGRRAAPAGQERGVNIEAAEPGGAEHRRRQDQAVRDHHEGIQVQRPQHLARLGRLEVRRLMHAQFQAPKRGS